MKYACQSWHSFGVIQAQANCAKCLLENISINLERQLWKGSGMQTLELNVLLSLFFISISKISCHVFESVVQHSTKAFLKLDFFKIMVQITCRILEKYEIPL